jgi:hypothetical protein
MAPGAISLSRKCRRLHTQADSGCLLASKLGLELRRVGSGKHMTFGPDEAKLSEWMGQNAFVAFRVCDRPGELEANLIAKVSLPLNLDQNRNHSFHTQLSMLRRGAKQRARSLLSSSPQECRPE